MNVPDAAAELHEGTKHTWARILAESQGRDWGNHPLPFKIYPDLQPLWLPRELPESSVPATEVLAGHVSAPTSALDLAGLARLLFFSAGVTRFLQGVLFRAAPSAGALYPTELYVVCGPLGDLPAGVYHFEPAEFALRRLRDGDFRARLAGSAAEPAIARLPLCLVFTGIPWRTTWKYGQRGYRHLFWDAGAIVANLLAVAAAAGWGAHVLLSFVDEEVAGLVGIGEPEEYPLALVTVEAPAVAEPAGSPPLGPISPRTWPLSRSPRSYPRVSAAQRAGELASAAAVTAWRDQASKLPALPATPSLAASDAGQAGAAADTIEAVILRRGSTRRRTHALCLGQDLCGDSAATVFHCARLEPILQTLAARGYRAAQLEGGVAAERLQLAAFALGFGASGVTFLDDDVSAFFGTRAAPMLAVAVGVPAYRARPGKRPAQLPRVGLAER